MNPFDRDPIRDAFTPEAMRAEINKLRRYDPLVSKVMMEADYAGMSAEDRYSVLAYHALLRCEQLEKIALQHLYTAPVKMIVPRSAVPKLGEHHGTD